MMRNRVTRFAVLFCCVVASAGGVAATRTLESDGLRLAASATARPSDSAAARTPQAAVAPELPSLPATSWVNSPPLTLASLRGRPVLIEFWTFGCSNCRNTLPWVQRTHARYGPRGLTVIAIHTPEFDHERDRRAVAQAVTRLGIRYPVLIDNDYAYWRALRNEYWPAFYLIDPQGRIVATRIGELHAGRRSADEFEAAIARLLRPARQEPMRTASHATLMASGRP